MDTAEVIELFDRQLRRDHPGGGPGDVVERAGGVVRHVGTEKSWCAVIWSDLDERGADAEIAEQIRYFSALGRTFEWKLCEYDRPSDLGQRLRKAGFVPGDPETVMVAHLEDLPSEPVLPDGVRIERVTDVAGARLMLQASELAFGECSPRFERYLLDRAANHPDGLTAIVVMAGDMPVCGARLEFHPGTQFASLWGGGTVPQWRGRGIYRATVAYRARLAAERGFSYLRVDASDDSRPILSRLGFQALTTITPYEYDA
jgi:GNAT superfamily N-acetyltransferase